MKKIITFFSLFSSMSTLLCCALPVVFVSLGMGATFASLTSNVPQIIWLVERKDSLFIVAGFLLALSYGATFWSARQSCPVDQDQREVCQESKSTSKSILLVSSGLYIIGVIFSFVLPLFI